jgi:hypothetical protein
MPDGNSILSQLAAYTCLLLGVMPTSCGVVQIEAVVTFCLYHLLADGNLGLVQPFDLVARVL